MVGYNHAAKGKKLEGGTFKDSYLQTGSTLEIQNLGQTCKNSNLGCESSHIYLNNFE